MDLAVTPAHQADFYRRAFQSVTAGKRPPRLLISGTTDYSMLAHVLAIYAEHGFQPKLTVVDICNTSLFLNHWYAQRASASVDCFRSDILEYSSNLPFDAICTDSFLGQFSPAERVRLLAKWHKLLCPGGTVITVTRVRATADTTQVGFSAEQAQVFRAAILRKVGSMPALRNEDPAEIARAADTYLSKQQTWPIRSHEEVRQLFERCGFRVDELSNTPDTTAIQRAASPGSGVQVRIIATRL